MGSLHTLQLYEHEPHTGLPSDSNSKLVSAWKEMQQTVAVVSAGRGYLDVNDVR